MKKNVCLNLINLDSKMPRFVTRINKKRNIANFMIEHLKSSYIKEMVEDIIVNGLNPLDAIGVFIEDEKYIALDGNRRILALKMIYDNKGITLSQEIQDILNIKKEMIQERKEQLFDNLEVFIFDNREKAKKWLNRKHTSDYGGASTQDWPTLEKKIFQKNQKALLISKEAKEANILYDDYAINVRYTIWAKFFASDFSREWLGLKYNKKNKIFFVDNREQLHERMRAIVKATKNKELNLTFVIKNENKLRTIKMLNQKYLVNSKFKKKLKKEFEIIKEEFARKILISNKAMMYITNEKLLSLINNINKLKINKYKELLACSIRPLVEISVNAFLAWQMEKSNSWFDNNTLGKRIIETIENLDSVDRENKAVIKYVKDNVEQCLHVWNADLHDELFSSSIKETRESFGRVSILLEEIWKNMN